MDAVRGLALFCWNIHPLKEYHLDVAVKPAFDDDAFLDV